MDDEFEPSERIRNALFIKLPHDAIHPDAVYAMPDPDALAPAFERLYRATYYNEGEASPEDIRRVLVLANGYLWLSGIGDAAHWSMTLAGEKLRDLWRARKARR